jgi:hypothetical protein
MYDTFTSLSQRKQNFILKSWAKPFADIVFPAINEERFRVLYSDNNATRPNAPANICVALEMLREFLGISDENAVESAVVDVRFHYALHATSFEEMPVSDRTSSRFPERIFQYEQETGRNLFQEEMESLAQVYCEFLNNTGNTYRMDSLMIAANAATLTRLELFYECVEKITSLLKRMGAEELLKGFEHYLDESDRNNTVYRSTPEERKGKIKKLAEDAVEIFSRAKGFEEFQEYQNLERMISEHIIIKNDSKTIVLKEDTDRNESSKSEPVNTAVDKKASEKQEDNSDKTQVVQSLQVQVRDAKTISAGSMQNPSEPDATYRKKNGKDHFGYVGNVVEKVGDKAAIITNFDLQKNTYSDQQFGKDVLNELGPQKEKCALLSDGGFASEENFKLAEENNINLVASTLIGKKPDEVLGEFQEDENEKKITKCPFGQSPISSTYDSEREKYRVVFAKEKCASCPYQDKCKPIEQKKTMAVVISKATINRARYLKKLKDEEYEKYRKKRNGIEGVPSVLRRKYSVDKPPVRGQRRVSHWFAAKIGAVNVARVIAAVFKRGKIKSV